MCCTQISIPNGFGQRQIYYNAACKYEDATELAQERQNGYSTNVTANFNVQFIWQKKNIQ